MILVIIFISFLVYALSIYLSYKYLIPFNVKDGKVYVLFTGDPHDNDEPEFIIWCILPVINTILSFLYFILLIVNPKHIIELKKNPYKYNWNDFKGVVDSAIFILMLYLIMLFVLFVAIFNC